MSHRNTIIEEEHRLGRRRLARLLTVISVPLVLLVGAAFQVVGS